MIKRSLLVLIFILIICYCYGKERPASCGSRYANKMFVMRGRFYYYDADGGNINTARAKCSKFSMHLMDLSTPEREQLFYSIQDKIKNPGVYPPWLWTSGELDVDRKVWVWTNLGEDYTHSNWPWEDPDPDPEYKYMAISYEGRWYTYRSIENYAFVCEMSTSY